MPDDAVKFLCPMHKAPLRVHSIVVVGVACNHTLLVFTFDLSVACNEQWL